MKRRRVPRPPTVRAVDLIAKKRDGGELEPAEIERLIAGFVEGSVADYQMSAFAMAVYLRGMSRAETTALTLAMRDSGEKAHLGQVHRPKVDKHSTGGVGDKVSIALAPLCAAAGLAVPMISGRGLGHTGGTLDKLEAIPGFVVDLPLSRFERLVARHGVCLIGQTEHLAPADRRLYALRDVTATVESVPLITASILSKKLCEDLDALVLDVKVGRGAFMKTQDEALELARSIVEVGRRAGTPTRALLTRMDSPLGRAVGNALETAEAIELLHDHGPEDLRECTLELAVEMLQAGGVARSRAAAEKRLREVLRDGSALSAFRAVVRAQGGDARVCDEPDRLPRAPVVRSVRSPSAGFVARLDALAVATLCMGLGAGRARAEDAIDPRVGVVLHKKPGDAVARGAALAELHLPDATRAGASAKALLEAYSFSSRRPHIPPLVIQRLR